MLTWPVVPTLSVAALAVLAALVGRVARCGPALRHALWLVVLLKLLTPPGLVWPWSLPSPPTWPTVAAKAGHVSDDLPPIVGVGHSSIILDVMPAPTGVEMVSE